jgi:hypothetical protein
MQMLNLGCGATCHPAWTNVDVKVFAPGVIAHDLTKGVPFSDARFDVVYCSHMLEHFEPEAGENFLRECLRVLKPGGVIRIVVPDLEQIVRAYLEKLDAAATGQPGADEDYDWMVIELLDLLVRKTSGGQTSRFFARETISNLPFVRSRIGAEVDKQVERYGNGGEKLRARWTRQLNLAASNPQQVLWKLQDVVSATVAGVSGGTRAARNLRVGSFRNSGECHQWMYDRYSLPRLLRKLGVEEVEVGDGFTSRIPEFEKFQLDVVDGKVRKPDSMFVEGVKGRL